MTWDTLMTVVEGPPTHLRVYHMIYHLNRKLYIGQDLLGLLLKKQSTWVQGEIYHPSNDYIWNCYEPSSANNVFCFSLVSQRGVINDLTRRRRWSSVIFFSGKEDELIWANKKFFSLIRFINSFFLQLWPAKLPFCCGE